MCCIATHLLLDLWQIFACTTIYNKCNFNSFKCFGYHVLERWRLDLPGLKVAPDAMLQSARGMNRAPKKRTSSMQCH